MNTLYLPALEEGWNVRRKRGTFPQRDRLLRTSPRAQETSQQVMNGEQSCCTCKDDRRDERNGEERRKVLRRKEGQIKNRGNCSKES